jgi:sulfite exporter TauE/SafE
MDILIAIYVGASMSAIGMIFYLTLFSFLSVPNILASNALVQLAMKRSRKKYIRHLPMIFPIAGLAFYMTIDIFEANNLFVLWFVILAIISFAPVVIYFALRKAKA